MGSSPGDVALKLSRGSAKFQGRARSRRGDAPANRFLAVGQLTAAVALTALLAYQAQDAARSHRATAKRVLEDYASLAAKELVRRATAQLGNFGVYYAFLPLYRTPWMSLPEPITDADLPPRRKMAHTYFRYDLSADQFRARGREDASFFRQHYLEPMLRDAPAFKPEWGARLLFAPGDALGAMAYRARVLEDESQAIEGFLLDRAILPTFFAESMAEAPLLPVSINGEGLDNQWLSIQAYGPGERPLFLAGPEPQPIAAAESFGGGLQGLRIELSIHAEAAPRLIIGGLPGSRLPLLAGLLSLAAILILTALRQLRRERELALRQADSIAAISHELRTPLAQIRMFTETLLLDRVRSDREGRRALEIIDQETQRLGDLVENVILFSSVLHRAGEAPLEAVDAGEALRDAANRFAPMVQSKGMSLQLAIEPGGAIMAAPKLLRRMLLNLLDNALKYGPAGQTITLGLALEPGRVLIRVEDQGEGVRPAERRRIWRRFERLPRHRNTATTGSGIGLWLVRELAAAQKGQAWVEEGAGGGARFTLAFARADPDAPTRIPD